VKAARSNRIADAESPSCRDLGIVLPVPLDSSAQAFFKAHRNLVAEGLFRCADIRQRIANISCPRPSGFEVIKARIISPEARVSTSFSVSEDPMKPAQPVTR